MTTQSIAEKLKLKIVPLTLVVGGLALAGTSALLFFGVGQRSGKSTVVCPITALPGLSQDLQQSTSADDTQTLASITKQLLQAEQDLRLSPRDEQQSSTVFALARDRKSLLLKVLATDPSVATDTLLIDDQSQSLTTNAPGCVEKPARYDGTLEIIHADHFDQNRSATQYLLNTPQGKKLLRFAVPPTTQLNSGATLSVTGVEIDGQVLTDGASPADDPSSAIGGIAVIDDQVAAVTGPRSTLVVMASYSNRAYATPNGPAVPPTSTQLQDMVFYRTGTNKTTGSVNSFFQENSYNAINLTGDVIGPTTINLTYPTGTDETNCSLYLSRDAVIAATDASVNFTQYSHILVILPFSQWACHFSGTSTSGMVPVVTADGTVSMSFAMISGWVAFPYILGHEFGHGLASQHAGFLNCGEEPIGADLSSPGCTWDEYGDIYDIMGDPGESYHYSASQLDALQWLSPTNLISITPTGNNGQSCVQESFLNNTLTTRCTLEPLETCSGGAACRPGDAPSTGLKAIKIRRWAGDNFLYAEFRRPLGYDSGFGTHEITTGATIHLPWGGTLHQTGLIDATSSAGNPGSQNTPVLLVGQTIRDPMTGATITTDSVTPTALVLRVVTGKSDFSTPTAAFASPVPGTAQRGTINVRVNASAPTGISKVEFYINNETIPFATDTTSPYVGQLDTTTLPNGQNFVKVKPYDRAGDPWGAPNNVGSSQANYLIDNIPPTVSLVPPPASGDTVSGTISLRCSVSDNDLVSSAIYHLDGNYLGVGSNICVGPYVWDTLTTNSGPHAITVIGFDRAGNSSISAPVQVNVSNSGGGGIDPLETQ